MTAMIHDMNLETRILIVEDSAAMRAYVRSALEDPAMSLPEEIEITEAANGLSALRLLPRGTSS